MRHLTDEYGSITARLGYDPCGASLQANTGSSLGFTGELTDPTGLVYLRARTYNPALGIFTSRDPVLGIVGFSTSYNGYGYVHGNPTNYRDPSGECPDGLGLLQCVAYDALDALNRVSITARQIIGIGAYVTATEVSPRAAAVSDWVLEHSGTYDLLDELSNIARHIDRDLLGNASQGTIQRGDMRRALQTILTQPYQGSAAFNQVRGDLEPSGWLVSLATLLYGARGLTNFFTSTPGLAPQLVTSAELALQMSVSVSVGAAVAAIPAYLGARELGENVLQMSKRRFDDDYENWPDMHSEADNRPSKNDIQNAEFERAIQEAERETGQRLSRFHRRRLHDEITGQYYSFTQIVQIAIDILRKR